MGLLALGAFLNPVRWCGVEKNVLGQREVSLLFTLIIMRCKGILQYAVSELVEK